NRGETDWEVSGRALPPYGFLARVPLAKGFAEASVTRRDGLIVEEARAPEQLYVNARGLSGPPRIRPGVTAARLDGGRQSTLPGGTGAGSSPSALTGQADAPTPGGYRPFLHFGAPRGEIVFQANQAPGAVRAPATKTIRTQATGTLPASAAPGTSFELLAGLF